MKHAFIGLLAAFLLGGCVTTGGRPGETHERIKGEMQSAVDGQRTPNADAVNQALLPPLQIDVPKAAEAVEPRFDLVVSNAPAAQVFMALVSGTRYSMLVSPELAGTVTVNVAQTVKELKAGKIQYRIDKGSNVHAPVGKLSFTVPQLAENAKTVIDSVVKSRPQTAKGVFIKSLYLSATMAPGVKLDMGLTR